MGHPISPKVNLIMQLKFRFVCSHISDYVMGLLPLFHFYKYDMIWYFFDRAIGLMRSVFTNIPGDWGSKNGT